VYPPISFPIPHILVLQDKSQFFIIFTISNLSRETFFLVLLTSSFLLRHVMIPQILLLWKIGWNVWFHVNYRGNQFLRDLLRQCVLEFLDLLQGHQFSFFCLYKVQVRRVLFPITLHLVHMQISIDITTLTALVQTKRFYT